MHQHANKTSVKVSGVTNPDLWRNLWNCDNNVCVGKCFVVSWASRPWENGSHTMNWKHNTLLAGSANTCIAQTMHQSRKQKTTMWRLG